MSLLAHTHRRAITNFLAATVFRRYNGGVHLSIYRAVLAVALATTAAAADAPPSPLPVTGVALFSSGVGYFEHAGQVSGNATSRLDFRTGQINDVLKSLVLRDSAGAATAVDYPSQDPLDKTLHSFQVDISQNPSSADLFNQLRGTRVAVEASGAKFEGTILGVERRTQVVTEQVTTEAAFLNLLIGGSLRQVPLDTVSTVTLLDKAVEGELNKALEAVAQARDQDRKPLAVSFKGTGERQVSVGYVMESPVWKTSYRLVLDSTAESLLQGWAIVENQTENDWTDVKLRLISGRPISFVQDLYHPLYVPRPTVQPSGYATVRPQEYGGGIEAPAAPPAPEPARKSARMTAPRAAVASEMAADMSEAAGVAPAPSPAALSMASNIAAVAESQKLGDYAEFDVGSVTIGRQRSAMLPIVSEKTDAVRVSIFNESVLASHPLLGVRLRNHSSRFLMAGPVTVFDSGSYAGDARLDDMPPGQDRLLSYGIDLGVVVNSEHAADATAVHTAKITGGTLELTNRLSAVTNYTFQNKDDHAKAVVLEQPLRHGWSLVETPKPAETTSELYRFDVSVGAAATEKFTVRQDLLQNQSVALGTLDPAQMLVYAQTGAISEPVRQALAKANALRREVSALDGHLAQKKTSLQAITSEQARIRSNMGSVQQTTDYYGRLVKKLSEQESQIEKIQSEQQSLEEQRARKQADLEAYLSTLNVG